MVLAFIPMYCIAVGYSELNKAEPDCGTTFTWAARAFGTKTGWMGGWGIIAADVIVMANLSQIAGSYTLQPVGCDDLAASTFWSTVAGIIWIAVMTYICYRGIEVSARLQYGLLGIEVVTLVAFAIFAIVKVYAGDAPAGIKPSLDWLSPSRPERHGDRERDADRRLHLLGLGHRRRHQRGVRRPGHDAGPRGDHLDRAAAAHLRPGLGGHDRLRRSRHGGHRARQRGQRRRRVRGDGPRGLRRRHGRLDHGPPAGHLRAHLGLRLDPDHDPAHRADQPVDGGVQGGAGAVREDPPEVPDADRVDDLDGRRLDRLLRAAHADQREHPGRHHRGGRAADRLLLRAHRLRVRVVLPEDDVARSRAT